jgi:hypothetical protein
MTSPDLRSRVATALHEAGEGASAAIWLRACRDLDDGPRVAVLARDPAVAARVARRLEVDHPELRWIAFGFAPDEDEVVPLGSEDRLLGAHAALWITALPAALGAEERLSLDALTGPGVPAERAGALVDARLLALISDDPERELSEIRDRLATLVPAGWQLREEPALEDFALSCLANVTDLRRDRQRDVARLLLGDALRSATESMEREGSAIAAIDALLEREEDSLVRACRDGERVASHLLGAMKRHAGGLVVDLRTFLTRVEHDLPAQIAGVADVEVVRRTLPHWLHHVVASYVTDRLARWRAEVVADLAEVGISPVDAARAELLVPSLHPPPIRAEGSWGHRLGVSAAIGGGAAMLAFGLWIPGAVALSGGLLWSTLGRDGREADTRDRLLESARTAVRRIGDDAQQVLSDQLTQIEADLAELGAEQARRVETQRGDHRARLTERRGFHRARRDALAVTRDALAARLADLAVSR